MLLSSLFTLWYIWVLFVWFWWSCSLSLGLFEHEAEYPGPVSPVKVNAIAFWFCLFHLLLFFCRTICPPTCVGVTHAVVHLVGVACDLLFYCVTGEQVLHCSNGESFLFMPVAFLLFIVYLYEAIQCLLLSIKSFIILPFTSKLGYKLSYTKGRMGIQFNFTQMKTCVQVPLLNISVSALI